MTSQVLPKEVRLSAPPTMPQARSYLFKQQSTQSLYQPGTSASIQINIPRLQRSYLTKDSYLRFRLTMKWTNNTLARQVLQNPTFDTPGAFGLFDTIEVYDYLGSTLLERTSGHGQLMALLLDTHCSPTESMFHYGTQSGLKGGIVGLDTDAYRTNPAGGALAFTDTLTRTLQMRAPHTGATLGNYSVAAANTAYSGGNNNVDYSYEFAIPLFSFLGTLSKKYAPLHNGYTINLTLNTVGNAFGFNQRDGTGVGATGAVAPTTYTLDKVFFCSQVLELGPVAESMLIASTQGQPFVVPAKAYRNYVGTIPTGTSAYRLDMNINVASLTNILFIMRDRSLMDSTLYKSLSYRIRNYLQSWYFQYGSTILPQTTGIKCRAESGETLDGTGAVTGKQGYVEAYNELMKARHNYSGSNTHSMISENEFWVDTPTSHMTAYQDVNYQNLATPAAAAALCPDCILPPGKFAGGLDLELVPGRSQDLICGMNTNGMNTSIQLNFDPSLTGSQVTLAQLDAWAEYDAFINISPGIATTVSF